MTWVSGLGVVYNSGGASRLANEKMVELKKALKGDKKEIDNV